MKPDYMVVVMADDPDRPYADIPEVDILEAIHIANYYRGRGFSATIVDYGAEPLMWLCSGHLLPTAVFTGRSADEALMRARLHDEGYDTVQLMG